MLETEQDGFQLVCYVERIEGTQQGACMRILSNLKYTKHKASRNLHGLCQPGPRGMKMKKGDNT